MLAAPAAPAIDPVFERDVFLLRQKHLSLKEQYTVLDEAGKALLYVERPHHFRRNIPAVLGGLLAACLVDGFFLAVSDSMLDPRAKAVSGLVGLLAGLPAFVLVYAQIARKRHVAFHLGDASGPKVLEVLQNDVVVFLTATYTVKDGATGRLLATLRKNHLYDVLRKRWEVFDAAGALVCVVQEDSWPRALLRRVLGPVFGALRTNFVFEEPATGAHLGEFLRRFTLLDRYVLRLRPGATARLDRRVAVAVGVMLDTGESR